jgi:hypothetical protein
MTDKMKQEAISEFTESLDKLKMSDGKINYKCNFDCEKCKATVLLTPEAYRKTVALLNEFSDEVAWHGSVSRSGEHEFTIEDIFVYPQEVTSGTVTTDQEAYTKWLFDFDDEVFPKIRMQGHSHVNMSVTPSGVDDNHRKQILEQLESDMFYIFMIWNKSLNINTLIYDMANNVLYENKDVDVKQIIEEDMDEFLTDAREKVQKRVAVTKPKKTKKQERLEQIQLQEFYDEFGTYPCSRSNFTDPFYSEMEGQLWRH